MSSIDVDADLATVRERADEVRPSGVAPRRGAARRWVAVAAAAAVLLVVGVVAMIATGDDDQIEVTGPSTTAAPAPTTVTTSTSASTSAPTSAPTTSVPPAPQLAEGVADPAVATPFQLITVTPSEAVVYCFMSQITVAAVDGAALRQVGSIGPDGSFTPGGTPPVGCDGAPPIDAAFSFRVPVALPAGDYVVCLSSIDVAAGCAPLSVVAWPEECFTEPIAPPGLIDGSAPGEPSLSADGTTATWGAGRVAISQVVGVRPDATSTSPSPFTAPGPIEVLYGRDDVATILSIIGSPDLCPRQYRLSPEFDQFDLRALADGWVRFLADGTPVPTDLHAELPAPVAYYGVRYVLVDGASSSVVHRFAPDGADLGPVDDGELVAPLAGVLLDDGRRIRFDPATQTDGACQNRPLLIGDSAGDSPLHPELDAAMSFVATPDGLVVATRHVCPDGTWGPSSFAQTVVLDLSDPGAGVQVLSEDEPRLDGLSPRSVHWISPDGGLVVFGEPLNAENSTLSMVRLGDPTTELVLPSGCATAGNMASVPVIVGDAMLIARACPTGANTAVTIDLLGATDLSLRWTATVERELLAYCSCVGVSAIDGEVPTVILTGSASVEVPNTSILVVGDQQTEITHFGFDSFAFTIPELLPALL